MQLIQKGKKVLILKFFRRDLGIRVEGERVPKPISSFSHLIIDQWILEGINKLGYIEPTPI